MTDKSHVTMEQHMCPVCTMKHETGALLLDKRLRPIFDKETVTGWGLCQECKKLVDDDRIALVEIDPFKSGPNGGSKLKLEDAYRTGNVAWLKTEIYDELFNMPRDPQRPMAFVDIECFQQIMLMGAKPEGNG